MTIAVAHRESRFKAPMLPTVVATPKKIAAIENAALTRSWKRSMSAFGQKRPSCPELIGQKCTLMGADTRELSST